MSGACSRRTELHGVTFGDAGKPEQDLSDQVIPNDPGSADVVQWGIAKKAAHSAAQKKLLCHVNLCKLLCDTLHDRFRNGTSYPQYWELGTDMHRLYLQLAHNVDASAINPRQVYVQAHESLDDTLEKNECVRDCWTNPWYGLKAALLQAQLQLNDYTYSLRLLNQISSNFEKFKNPKDANTHNNNTAFKAYTLMISQLRQHDSSTDDTIDKVALEDCAKQRAKLTEQIADLRSVLSAYSYTQYREKYSTRIERLIRDGRKKTTTLETLLRCVDDEGRLERSTDNISEDVRHLYQQLENEYKARTSQPLTFRDYIMPAIQTRHAMRRERVFYAQKLLRSQRAQTNTQNSGVVHLSKTIDINTKRKKKTQALVDMLHAGSKKVDIQNTQFNDKVQYAVLLNDILSNYRGPIPLNDVIARTREHMQKLDDNIHASEHKLRFHKHMRDAHSLVSILVKMRRPVRDPLVASLNNFNFISGLLSDEQMALAQAFIDTLRSISETPDDKHQNEAALFLKEVVARLEFSDSQPLQSNIRSLFGETQSKYPRLQDYVLGNPNFIHDAVMYATQEAEKCARLIRAQTDQHGETGFDNNTKLTKFKNFLSDTVKLCWNEENTDDTKKVEASFSHMKSALRHLESLLQSLQTQPDDLLTPVPPLQAVSA